MNAKSLRAYADANSKTFAELAKCASVAELMVRLAAYGKNWNRWSWAVFFNFLWRRLALDCEKNPGWSRATDEAEEDACRSMLRDVLDTIDSGTLLDSVVTDKVVVMTTLQLVECFPSDSGGHFGLYCVLAHAFAKFPSLWNVSWMYVRHARPVRGRQRTHRLEAALPGMASRPARYFDSKAFMDDFVHKYWDFERLA